MKFHFYYAPLHTIDASYWLSDYYSFSGEGYKHRIFRLFGVSLLVSVERPVE